MKRRFIAFILFLVTGIVMLTSCGGNKASKLIGSWVAPDASNQRLEITTDEVWFNYRRFEYSVDHNVIHLKQTMPTRGLVGDITYKFDGDTLVIDLGEDMSGYFYGRSGTVRLNRQ